MIIDTLWLTKMTMENHHFHWNNSLSMALSGISSSGFFPAFETPGRSISSFIPRRQQRPQRRRSHRTPSPDIFVWKTHRVYQTQHLGSWSHLFKTDPRTVTVLCCFVAMVKFQWEYAGVCDMCVFVFMLLFL